MKKNVFSQLKTRAARAYIMASTTVTGTLFPIISYAEGEGGAGSSSVSVVKGATDIAKLFVTLIALVGLYYLIPGAYKVFTAWKEGRGDDMHDAAKTVIVGLVMIFFRVFAWPVIEGFITTAAL